MTLHPRLGSLRLPLILGGAVVVVAAVGFVLTLNRKPAGTGTNTGSTVTGDSVEAVTVPTRADADADGLTDAEEETLRTSPTKADTDADGLTDREEAKVYGTDPLKSDTDGDGHADGAEVRGGFNPNGPGELLPSESAIRNLNTVPTNTNQTVAP